MQQRFAPLPDQGEVGACERMLAARRVRVARHLKIFDNAIVGYVLSAFSALVYEWSRRGGELDIEGAISQTLDVVLHGLNETRPHPRKNSGS